MKPRTKSEEEDPNVIHAKVSWTSKNETREEYLLRVAKEQAELRRGRA